MKSFVTILTFILMVFTATFVLAQRIIDLDQVNGDIRVLGWEEEGTGYTVAGGDINGDGYDDLVVGAYWGKKVYVICGGADLPSIIDLDTTNADMTIYGERASFSNSLACGDINGDGFDDLIIGAFQFHLPERAGAGKTYVIYGDSTLPSVVDLNSIPADLTVLGAAKWDGLGASVASGDVNGDGVDDLIMGAIEAAMYNPGTGKVHIVYGRPDLPAEIDLYSTDADVTLYGMEDGDRTGQSVASGDINNDGFDDVIVGATCFFSDCQPSKTFVVFGSPDLPSVIHLNYALIISGEELDLLGTSVCSGDVNGDGFDDVIIGALGNQSIGPSVGKTYVICGGKSMPRVIDLSTDSADLTILGEGAGDYFGYSVSCGDVNGDGRYDVIVGAYQAHPPGRWKAGKTFVVLGNSDLSPTIDLSNNSADITIYGDDSADFSGFSVSSGDINGDGIDDVIVGTRLAGETYVIYGKATTDVEETEHGFTALPEDYALGQNFPNPFNATTEIRYRIPDEARGARDERRKVTHVSLRIFNMLGQEVRTLVEKPQEPGYYSVRWEGKDNAGIMVSSGVYFYRIIAEQFQEAKKMQLIK